MTGAADAGAQHRPASEQEILTAKTEHDRAPVGGRVYEHSDRLCCPRRHIRFDWSLVKISLRGRHYSGGVRTPLPDAAFSGETSRTIASPNLSMLRMVTSVWPDGITMPASANASRIAIDRSV